MLQTIISVEESPPSLILNKVRHSDMQVRHSEQSEESSSKHRDPSLRSG